MKKKLRKDQPGRKALWRNKLKLALPFLVLIGLVFVKLRLSLFGQKRYGFILVFDRIFVFSQKGLVWQSPTEWQVKDFLLADLNRDEKKELNLVVFKWGRYGDRKPFWVKQDNEFGCHFFVLGVKEDRVFPVWQSSQIENPICQAQARDIDKDGKLELVVREGAYRKNGYSCFRTAKTVWEWNGWGFNKLGEL